jgi:hypothetical protein
MNIFQKINQYYQSAFAFIEKETSTQSLVFLRISLGLIAILKFAVYGRFFLDFHGQYGMVPWAISKAGIYPFLPHLGDAALWLSDLTGQSLDSASYTLLYVFIGACICLMLGFLTRLSSLICFFLHLCLIYAASGYMYGVDVFTQIGFFYCIFFPMGSNWSLDNALGIRKVVRYSTEAGIAKRLIQFQLCLIYFSTAIEKGMGTQWWNGEAIWRTFMLPTFKHFDFGWMAYVPAVPLLMGWSILLIEFSYIFLVWIPKYRTFAVVSVVLMHTGIGLFMGMWLFAAIMICFNLFAFGTEILADLAVFSRRYKELKPRFEFVKWQKKSAQSS